MRTFAIGDVQGCYNSLMKLLDKLHYSPSTDRLWFAGDLVNRGSDSLACLRFVKNLGTKAITVLGNHDLYLIALHYKQVPSPSSAHTLESILQAPDAEELCAWLQQQPLLYHDPELNMTLVHAGIYPLWDLAQAQAYAQEIETALRNDSTNFLRHMYGDFPHQWQNELQGLERLRFITNAFTRMRLVNKAGELDFTFKETSKTIPAGWFPWFTTPGRKPITSTILFGHWSALQCETFGTPNLIALDSGCVWGGSLTAVCVETLERFSVPCAEK